MEKVCNAMLVFTARSIDTDSQCNWHVAHSQYNTHRVCLVLVMFAHVLIQESLSSEHLTTKSTLPLDTTMLESGSILCIISALYHSPV